MRVIRSVLERSGGIISRKNEIRCSSHAAKLLLILVPVPFPNLFDVDYLTDVKGDTWAVGVVLLIPLVHPLCVTLSTTPTLIRSVNVDQLR